MSSATAARAMHRGIETDSSADDLLGRTWLGASLPPACRVRLAAIGEVIEYPKGSILVPPGIPAPGLGIIVRGRVALRASVSTGREQTLLTLDDDDLFGWSAVLPGSLATARAVAIAPTTAILFPRSALQALLEADTELAAAVYRWVLGAVARRLQATRLQLLDIFRLEPEAW